MGCQLWSMMMTMTGASTNLGRGGGQEDTREGRAAEGGREDITSSPPLTAASPDAVEKMMMETMIIIMMDLAPVAVDVKGRDVTPMCSSRIMCG